MNNNLRLAGIGAAVIAMICSTSASLMAVIEHHAHHKALVQFADEVALIGVLALADRSASDDAASVATARMAAMRLAATRPGVQATVRVFPREMRVGVDLTVEGGIGSAVYSSVARYQPPRPGGAMQVAAHR